MKYLLTVLMFAFASFAFSAEHKADGCHAVKKEHMEALKALREKHKSEIDAFVADKPKLKEALENRRARMSKIAEKRRDVKGDKVKCDKHRKHEHDEKKK